jgi:predicted dehydrogenase
MALAAIQSGLHVLLEKPMAANYGDAQAIAQAAAEAGVVLTVYQPHRLAAYFQQLRRLLEAGRIGPVYWVRRGMFSFIRRNDWQSLQQFGGGMLNNYGAHALDQVLHLIGYDVARVFCDLQLAASLGDADDVVKVVVETKQGVVGEVDINQASVISPYELMVWGTCGAIVYHHNQFQIRSFDPGRLPPKEVDPHLASADRRYPSDDVEFVDETLPVDSQYEIDLYADLARAIRGGTSPAVDPQE